MSSSLSVVGSRVRALDAQAHGVSLAATRIDVKWPPTTWMHRHLKWTLFWCNREADRLASVALKDIANAHASTDNSVP